MKKLCLVFVGSLVTIVVSAQREIKPVDAKDNVGETVKVCALIGEASFQENAPGSPTRLYSSADTAHSPLTFIIWGEKRKNFDYKPEKDLKEREVCITGKIELYQEKPVIIVERQSQVKIR